MKDYKHLVLWTDYFNSSLSREQGRRVRLDGAVKDPSLRELAEALRRVGLNPESIEARHPKRMISASGYVSVQKRPNQKKELLIDEVSKTLSAVRGDKASVSASSKNPVKPVPRHKR